ncbi:uncharacterized protein LOC135139874 [Zophobas morio]|uniref:uncharacterized protein LOC135139874 n=1 Tax=Zophobas morio TaxID=2755281 RepID=UPI003082B1D5
MKADNNNFMKIFIKLLTIIAYKTDDQLYPHVPRVALLIISLLEDLNAPNSEEGEEFLVDSILCLNALFRKCPNQMSPFVKEVIRIGVQYISYDPTFGESEVELSSTDSEHEDDEETFSENDDQSYKVRLACSQLLSCIFSYAEHVKKASLPTLEKEAFRQKRTRLSDEDNFSFVAGLDSVVLCCANRIQYEYEQLVFTAVCELAVAVVSFIRTCRGSVDIFSPLIGPLIKKLRRSKEAVLSACLKVLTELSKSQFSCLAGERVLLAEALSCILLAPKSTPVLKRSVVSMVNNFIVHQGLENSNYMCFRVYQPICEASLEVHSNILSDSLELFITLVPLVASSVAIGSNAEDVGALANYLHDWAVSIFSSENSELSVKGKSLCLLSLIQTYLGAFLDALKNEFVVETLMASLRSESFRFVALEGFERIAVSPNSSCFTRTVSPLLLAIAELFKEAGTPRASALKTVRTFLSNSLLLVDEETILKLIEHVTPTLDVSDAQEFYNILFIS